MNEIPWQLQIFEKSIKKKDKLKLLQKYVQVSSSSLILDLGCAQGILSYFLRQKGGFWISTDLDFSNLKTSQMLLQTNLVQAGPGILPFKDGSFDMVVSLDYLEHLDDDDLCLREVHRLLKKGGELVLATPHTGKFFLIHKLRPRLGLKLEMYGHKREGYSLKCLKDKLKRSSFQFVKHKTFSRFFSEFIELLINFLYIRFLSPDKTDALRDGQIRPTTSEEFRLRKKSFKMYSMIYPLLWLTSRLDKLLFFQKGYSLMIWAKKP